MSSRYEKVKIKSVDNNGVVIMHPMDDIKVEFKIKKNFDNGTNFIKCFVDEKYKYWGEYCRYYTSGQILSHGFFANDKQIGKWTYYNEDGSKKSTTFYSFEGFWVNIEESEYKIQLAKIRLGLLKVPALDLKISDYEC